MLLPGSFATALAMMLAGMLCWGSWTNAHRLARNWRFELFHWDYAIGVFLIAILAAATAGRFFGPPDFLSNMAGADREAWLYATAGGAALNAGNLLLMAGIVLVGMTVAFPVSVGLSLVVSTVLSYLVTPRGDPALLAAGVVLVLAAVVTNSAAYRAAVAKKAGVSRSGLAICILAGMLFSISGPLVAKALASARPLAPYGAAVLYASGSLLSTPPLLLLFMRRPIQGAPLTMRDYLHGSARNHGAGLLGGLTWGAGMVLTFAAAGLAGMAVAGAVGQANPLVAAVWGIFVWREFRGAPPRAGRLLAVMFLLYLAGLVCLGLSFRGI